ncbi:MAG: hypothetical protein HYS77_15545 [Candidatus Rokubacteria bacterium]|nr:hypothetical protein [Candidatus Rokubacteria bacterium]
MHGGHYETVTAGRAVLRGGAYFAPGLGRIGDVMAAMRQAVARMNAADPFLRARPATLAFLHHDDATEQPVGLGFARDVLAALGAPSGRAPHAAPFACDLRHLVNQGGMPGIVFGPGSIAEAHRPDERVPLGQYHAAIERLIAILVAWCGV